MTEGWTSKNRKEHKRHNRAQSIKCIDLNLYDRSLRKGRNKNRAEEKMTYDWEFPNSDKVTETTDSRSTINSRHDKDKDNTV